MPWLGPAILLLAAVVRVIDVAPVWSGHPVRFDLLTEGNRQFVAFYDDQRRMTVGVRTLDSRDWRFIRLPSQLGWDSHNDVVMGLDKEGHLHVSGNMHVIPLVYFRTAKPYDIESFEAIHKMVGRDEGRCTYPQFFRGPGGELIFGYRDGQSGRGNQIYNAYDTGTKTWRRLADRPFPDGEGKKNAYPFGPVLGPDGYFHLVWVWRDTPDCSSNHDLSYARSKDLVHWEAIQVVDPVPVKGGMINGCARIAWDAQRRPVISYHKFDEKGLTQVYTARLEAGRWRIRRASNWDYRWDFQGPGTIPFDIRLGGLVPAGQGKLALDFEHVKYGAGRLVLFEETLSLDRQAPPVRPWPAELDQVQSKFPGMQVRTRAEGTRWLLRWETLGENRDRPREGSLPEPSMLRLYEIKD